MKKETEDTSFPIQYLEDLAREATIYLSMVIAQVMNGIKRNISPKNTGARNLQKALLAAGIVDKLKAFGNKLRGLIGFKGKSPKEPFTVRGLKVYVKGKPMSQTQYEDLERQIGDYMQPYISTVAEEMSVKGVMLAMASAQAEANQQNIEKYGTANISEIQKKYFGGKTIPDTIKSTVERYHITKPVEKVLVSSYDRAAMHCSKMEDSVRQAVRSQIVSAHEQGLSATELASNLYWDVQKDEELKSKNTAESLMKDWRRIAYTELAAIHSDAKIAAVDEPGPAYFAFIGGTCEFCRSHQGTIMLLLSGDRVGDENDDSLASRGIKDDYADIGVWAGKNNVGLKRVAWRVCVPAHPWNKAQLVRVNPRLEKYDAKSGRFKREKGGLEKYIPKEIIRERDTKEAENRERLDARIADAQKREWKKDIEYYEKSGAKAVSPGIAERNGQRYRSVKQSEFIDELEKWRNDRSLPIPIGDGQREHEQLFG